MRMAIPLTKSSSELRCLRFGAEDNSMLKRTSRRSPIQLCKLELRGMSQHRASEASRFVESAARSLDPDSGRWNVD